MIESLVAWWRCFLRQGVACLLATLLATIFPIALLMPEHFAWENGWIEKTQTIILLLGFSRAAWTWGRLHCLKKLHTCGYSGLLRLTTIAFPIWLMLFGRETSWGATFMAPVIMQSDGPVFSSSNLWYHDAIKPIVLLSVAAAVTAFSWWRLDRFFIALAQRDQFPGLELLLTVLAAGLSAVAEGKFHFQLPGSSSLHMSLEELSEATCYLGLLLTQEKLFGTLAQDETF